MQRSFSSPAIVLKRSNLGESDRVVTLLTQSQGKIACIAKGVRKMQSSNRATVEPGNYITAFMISTKGMPILTQTRLLDNFSNSKTTLAKLRQMTQILEIVDRLFVENLEDASLFAEIVSILKNLNSPRPQMQLLTAQLENMVAQLGYQSLQESGHTSFMEYIGEITDKPMHSWEYLRVK